MEHRLGTEVGILQRSRAQLWGEGGEPEATRDFRFSLLPSSVYHLYVNWLVRGSAGDSGLCCLSVTPTSQEGANWPAVPDSEDGERHSNEHSLNGGSSSSGEGKIGRVFRRELQQEQNAPQTESALHCCHTQAVFNTTCDKTVLSTEIPCCSRF